jgi:hypothetical protein
LKKEVENYQKYVAFFLMKNKKVNIPKPNSKAPTPIPTESIDREFFSIVEMDKAKFTVNP